jgi:hypothetical protein
LSPLALLSAVRDARGLTVHEKVALFVLAAHADAQGRCFPSYSRIALACGVSRSTAIKSIATLRARGALEVEHRATPRGTTSNVFVLSLDAVRGMSECDPVSSVNPVSNTDPPSLQYGPGGSPIRTPLVSNTDPEGDQGRDPMKEPKEAAAVAPLQLLPSTPESGSNSPEGEVWEYFQTVRKRWRSRSRPTALGDKDRREMKARLKAGYSVDDLKLAVDGLFASTWHRENDHLGLTYALREANIARFIDVGERERCDAPTVAPALPPSRAEPDEPRDHTFDLGSFAETFKAS